MSLSEFALLLLGSSVSTSTRMALSEFGDDTVVLLLGIYVSTGISLSGFPGDDESLLLGIYVASVISFS